LLAKALHERSVMVEVHRSP